jgi:hypothetical protein
MALSTGVAAIIASCMNPLHPDYFAVEPKAGYQLKCKYGVNKIFWQSYDDMVLEWVCPGYPTTLGIKLWEHKDDPSTTDPLIYIFGYVALCAQPPPAIGTSDWLWMATLTYITTNTAFIPVTQIHLQYKNTNAGSIGFILYPQIPSS